ncbi:MAG: flagellar hook-length control protein FliK [Pseudomonadota bacterium]
MLTALAQLERAAKTGAPRVDARRVLDVLNTPDQVTRLDGLRRAILNSGLFLEARLAGKSAEPVLDVSRDFKAALLRLRAELGPQLAASPDARTTDLASQVERTLARLDLSQLATVSAERDSRLAWSLEIPVRSASDDVDVASLSIEREDRDGDGAADRERAYTAVIRLEPNGLGPITAQLRVVGERVSVGFAIADPASRRRVDEHLDALRTGLGRRGLTPTRLSADQAAALNGADDYPAFTDTQV